MARSISPILLPTVRSLGSSSRATCMVMVLAPVGRPVQNRFRPAACIIAPGFTPK